MWIVGSLFLIYAGVSLLLLETSLLSAVYLLSLILAFGLGVRRQQDYVWLVVVGFVCVNVLLSAIYSNIPYGLFGNPNYFGCGIALAVAVCLYQSWWWGLPLLGVGVYQTQSRGAVAAIGFAALVVLWQRGYRATAICAVLAATAMVLHFTIGREAPIFARVGVWQDTLGHLTLFGHGWDSFQAAYAAFPRRTNMTENLAPHAYNDVLELLFSFGLGAVFLFAFVILAFEGTDARAKLVLATFGVLGLTYFPLSIPFVGHLALYALGGLAISRLQPERNPQWLRVGA